MAQGQIGLSQHDIDKLKQRHQELSERVHTLDSQLHLTANEEIELHRLKKEKLQTKDRLLKLV